MILKLLNIAKSNEISLLVLRCLGVGLLFLATLIMTNYYEQSIVGEFEFTRSLLLLLGSIVLLGTDRSILQFAGQLSNASRMNEFKDVYKKIIFLFLIFSLVLFIVYWIIPAGIVNNLSAGYLIIKIISCLFFYAVALFNTEVFRVFDKNNWSEIYRGFLKYILLFIAAVGFLFLEITHLIIDAFLVSFILLAIISSIHLRKLIPKTRHKSKLSYQKIIKVSFPMALSSLGFFLLLSIDMIFLKYFEGDDLIAIYAQPVKIIALIAMIQTTLEAAIAKSIASLHDLRDWKALINIIKKYNRIIAFLSIPFLILFLIFPKTILSFFGAEYVYGSNVLLILIIGTFINAICGCTSVYMNMTGKQVEFRNIIFMTVVLNIVLNIFLVPSFGIEGAAVASSFSLMFWNLVTVIYVFRKERIILILN